MFAYKKNIKYFFLKLQQKIKRFLLSDKSREFLVFLFFFLVSTGFWLLQTLKNDYETELAIPLRLKNIPNDVVMTSDFPNELRIGVKDKGTVLLNYMLGQSFYPITLDFEDYANRGNHVFIYSRDLEKKIAGQLASSTRLLSIKPDTIDFIYSKGKAKMIPVRIRGNISTGHQYYITDTIFSPDSVVVYAPKAMLDTIKYAYTQMLNLENLTDTIKQTVLLERVKGAKFVPNSVVITLPVDIITEKTLEVPLVGVNFPPNRVLRTFPSKVKVTFQIGLNRFKYIHANDFVLQVPYDDLIKSGSDKYRVRLSSVPFGVSHVRIVPEEVDFLIEQVAANGY